MSYLLQELSVLQFALESGCDVSKIRWCCSYMHIKSHIYKCGLIFPLIITVDPAQVERTKQRLCIRVLKVLLRPQAGIVWYIGEAERQTHHSLSNKEVSMRNQPFCGFPYCHSKFPHLHMLIAELNGEASCSRLEEAYLSDDRGRRVSIWSNNELKVSPKFVCLFGRSQGSVKRKQDWKKEENIVGVRY